MSELTTTLRGLFRRWVAQRWRRTAKIYRKQAADLSRRAELLEFEAAKVLQHGE